MSKGTTKVIERKAPAGKSQVEAREHVARESKRELESRKKRRATGREGALPQRDSPKPPKRLSAREAALAKAEVIDGINKRKADKVRAKNAVAGKPLTIDLANPSDEVLDADPAPESIPVEGALAKPGQRLAKAERRVEALNMKIVGHDYRVIAETLGVNVKTAYMDVQEALVYLAKHERVLAERVRELELARLDALGTQVWPGVERGDPFAVQAYLKIMDQRARMLGLYAPERHEIDDHRRPHSGMSDEELSRRIGDLQARIARSKLSPSPVALLAASTEPEPIEPMKRTAIPETSGHGWTDTEPDLADPQ